MKKFTSKVDDIIRNEKKSLDRTSEINYFPNDLSKHIDYVIYYKETHKDAEKLADVQLIRKHFLQRLEDEGFTLHFIRVNDSTKSVYVLLNCNKERLMEEAERMQLQFPLKDNYKIDKYEGLFDDNKFIEKFKSCFQTPVVKAEIDDVFATFETDIRQIFKDFEEDFKNSKGFPNSLRFLLVDQILAHLYFDDGKQSTEDDLRLSLLKLILRYYQTENLKSNKSNKLLANLANKLQLKHIQEEFTVSSKLTAKAGLPYMIQENYFEDAFVLHDDTGSDERRRQFVLHLMRLQSNKRGEEDANQTHIMEILAALNPKTIRLDRRSVLDKGWASFKCIFKFQPLYQIRNYFGEYIALYFAWCGVLTTSLIFPSIVGSAFFIAGLVMAVKETSNKTYNASSFSLYENLYTDTFVRSFNNILTQAYAGIICVWGILFREYWKRESIRITYDWRTDNYEAMEGDRIEYTTLLKKWNKKYGTNKTHYPRYLYYLKILLSYVILIFMILIVALEIALIAALRLFFENILFKEDPTLQFVIGILGTVVLNTIVIIVMDKLYYVISEKLNDWECARTQSEYNDSLIIKRFIFEFVNSYGSLFYIAIFRNTRFVTFESGLFGLGSDYKDECDGSECMMLLTIQVILIIVSKPFPRFFITAIWPFLVSRYTKYKYSNIVATTKGSRTNRKSEYTKDLSDKEKQCLLYISVEKDKEQLETTIHDEYIEKIVIYGYVMIFACSFNLAPLVFLITLLIDIRVDAKRLLWVFRRPIPYKAQDIGIFLYIIDFINLCAVITNAFIIGFSSNISISSFNTIEEEYAFVITFEHIIILCFVVIYCLPSSVNAINFNKRQEAIYTREAILAARMLSGTEKTKAAHVKSKYNLSSPKINSSQILIRPKKHVTIDDSAIDRRSDVVRNLFSRLSQSTHEKEDISDDESSNEQKSNPLFSATVIDQLKKRNKK